MARLRAKKHRDKRLRPYRWKLKGQAKMRMNCILPFPRPWHPRRQSGSYKELNLLDAHHKLGNIFNVPAILFQAQFENLFKLSLKFIQGFGLCVSQGPLMTESVRTERKMSNTPQGRARFQHSPLRTQPKKQRGKDNGSLHPPSSLLQFPDCVGRSQGESNGVFALMIP